MKIVVIGGSGLIGSRLVTKLREQGHEAVAASPNSGVNSLTGKGLAEALKGASVVVDVTNSPSWEDAAVMTFFETSTRNLLAYGAAAGVKHHVALSVVVFEFVKGIADFSTEGNKIRLPTALIQPMAADDVASAVGRVATGAPVNGTVEVGGPEKFRLDELVRQFLAARKDPREVVPDPQALYYGVKLGENTLLPGDVAPLGERRFEDWLSLSASQILPTKPLTTAVAAASNQSSGPQK